MLAYKMSIGKVALSQPEKLLLYIVYSNFLLMTTGKDNSIQNM